MYSIPSGIGPNIVAVISVQIYVSKWSLKQHVSTVCNVGLGVGLNMHIIIHDGFRRLHRVSHPMIFPFC